MPQNISVTGLSQSSQSYFIYALLKSTPNINIVFAAHNDGIDELYNAITFYEKNNIYSPSFTKILPTEFQSTICEPLPLNSIVCLKDFDVPPYQEFSVSLFTQSRRVKALTQLLTRSPKLLITTPAAFFQTTLHPNDLKAHCLTVKKNAAIDPESLSINLVAAGYQRHEVVETIGSFAIRGGIIDVFSPYHTAPVRIELFGDDVESIRLFDSNTQESVQALDAYTIIPMSEIVYSPKEFKRIQANIFSLSKRFNLKKHIRLDLNNAIMSYEDFIGRPYLLPCFYESTASSLDYLSTHMHAPIITTQTHLDYEELMTRYTDAFSDYVGEDKIASLIQDGLMPINKWKTFQKKSYIMSLDGLTDLPKGHLQHRTSCHDHLFLSSKSKQDIFSSVASQLNSWKMDGRHTLVVTNDDQQSEKLKSLLLSHISECSINILKGPINKGFGFDDIGFELITSKDLGILGRRGLAKNRQPGHSISKVRKSFLAKTSSLEHLALDDFVVHTVHGIGKFKGLQRITANTSDSYNEFIVIEYSGGNLFVPIYNANMVQRYFGVDGKKPQVDSLGGKTFSAKKSKAKKAVEAIAQELVLLYAKRAQAEGFSFDLTHEEFDAFEESFEFDETKDQVSAIEDTLTDMHSTQPMDRLICGDVGFGKTEIALRAACIAALNGKQVALLAPTTVLVMQHFLTTQKRFHNLPITIRMLSRFQSKKDQRIVLEELKNGRVDIVVGTHRLLSKDVKFKSLGLYIIDEEQRFGVTHKEKIKEMRNNVDILTLTATPIPRTLHMAMLGIRDLSVIETPPHNRRTIQTRIARFSDKIIKDAVQNELQRNGQVFFVHDRVQSIQAMDAYLKELLPNVSIGIVHGQLPESQLEKAMLQFIQGEFDILLCTKIIESGLDIPNVNTIIINRADNFGLAELYQLRGRVGRSQRSSFAYFLVPDIHGLSSDAQKRLNVLKRFNDLGSGFKIAAHDLEIRGGGSLLGTSQSGHIGAIGFELYTQILESTIKEMHGNNEEFVESGRQNFETELKINIVCAIPDTYIPDNALRISVYRQLSLVATLEELNTAVAHIKDRFGKLPDGLVRLAELLKIKCIMVKLKIPFLEVFERAFTFRFFHDSKIHVENLFTLIADLKAKSIDIRITPLNELKVFSVPREFNLQNNFDLINSVLKNLM